MGTVYSCWKTSSSWGPARIGSDIRLQHYCKEVCLPLAVHEACLASLPLLSRFGVGAVLICSRCCLPPWGGYWTCNCCVFLSCLAPWLYTVSCRRHFGNSDHERGGLPPVATPRLRYVCSAVCSIAASLSYRRVQFCLQWTFQLRAYGSLSRALAKH